MRGWRAKYTILAQNKHARNNESAQSRLAICPDTTPRLLQSSSNKPLLAVFSLPPSVVVSALARSERADTISKEGTCMWREGLQPAKYLKKQQSRRNLCLTPLRPKECSSRATIAVRQHKRRPYLLTMQMAIPLRSHTGCTAAPLRDYRGLSGAQEQQASSSIGQQYVCNSCLVMTRMSHCLLPVGAWCSLQGSCRS